MRPPFLPDPPIKTYQSNAYALGAFLALGEGTSAILDNNFITWGCVSDLKKAPRPILFLPFISPETFATSRLGSLLSFRAFTRAELSKAIVSSLQCGFLVRLGVDEYHIPDRRSYRNKHRVHDVLVTAATPSAESFELMGYCADRRYRPSTCSLEDLSTGYFSAAEKAGKQGFLAFRAELPRPITVDLAAIRRQLEFFLESRDSARNGAPTAKTGEPILHGLAVFDACVRYVRSLTPTEWLDRRVFSLMAEHSGMMLRRTFTVESLLEMPIAKTSAERAVHTAGRLKLLSLLPEPRRNEASFAEMAALFGRLKEESRNAAETLWQAIGAYDRLPKALSAQPPGNETREASH
jgi:hypothetical protein